MHPWRDLVTTKWERAMRTSERRLGAKRPVPLPDRRWEEIASSGSWPDLAGAVLPGRIDIDRVSLYGQSDETRHGKLAYAVHKATASEEKISDEMLLKSVAEGDKAAMHIMFARHRTRVFRFVQRMVRNAAIAEDLVSQVFLDVWRSANSFEERSRVSTWLLSIARFKAIGALRTRTRAHETIDQDEVLEIADAADTPEVALDRKETNGILHTCMEKLSPAHREIIDMVYYREKSVVEVSEMIGIPIATAKSRIFYARKRLAKILVGAGLEAAAIRTNIDEARAIRPSRGLHLKIRAESAVI
jgi:RNA polymerase sigma-70 factor, ECF subfamily